jgi:hypothetical protein
MTSSRRAVISGAISVLGLVLFFASCHPEPPRFEGLDPGRMPEEVRADYALFAQRCSKCHSLARPLQSGIVSDEYWAEYVERMRRQPGSDISIEDTVPIRRFLHFFSTGQVARGDVRPLEVAPAQDGGAE